MGKLHLNSGTIQDFNVQLVTENGGHVAALIMIETDRGATKYRISIDDRHPNLNQIVIKLNAGLQAAKDSNVDLQINEYSERTYIFVTYPEGETEQYTGSSI